MGRWYSTWADEHEKLLYNGEWRDDELHGKGIRYYKDGSRYEGDWENGYRMDMEPIFLQMDLEI